MNDNRTTCDPERTELFLQQKLSDAEQTAFELHLDHCEECRQRLEASAAGEDIWSGVRDSLRDQPLPPDGPRSGDSALDSAADEASSSQATVLKLLAPTDDDRMIGRWGTYEVVGVVGTGGMGVVLKAFDAALNRYVAIKVLAPHLGSSGAARKRFSREAQAAAAVVHDNVIEIYGVAEAAGLPYLVMPYIRGPSLQRRLDGEGPLALVEILRVGMQAAAGLAAAHAQGLVHRDVKPANILLADGVERVKLTDFGLARAADDASLTKTGIIAGTPQYMSPEQARGESVDQRSDLFSLGSVLYATCTGRAPFRAETSYGVLRRITDEKPRPIREINPDIPEWLCQIVAKLMSKRPGDRFQSAREVAGLLEECLAHVQQPTVVPLPAALPKPACRRAWWPPVFHFKGVLATIAALGAGLLGVLLLSATPPDIAGKWSGEDWGQVVLTQTAPGQYSGTYTETEGKGPGKIDVKWLRIERRFNGTWSEGEDRFGDLSIRLADQEIRGALTTDRKSKINPATPRLADLLWKRGEYTANSGQPVPAAASREANGPAAERPVADAETEPHAQRRPKIFLTVFNNGYGDDLLPTEAERFEKLARTIAVEGHFNALMCRYSPQREAACRKYGLLMIVDLLARGHHVYKNPKECRQLCERLRGNPTIAAYHLWSDPFGRNRAGRARDIDNVHQWDPTHATYIGTYIHALFNLDLTCMAKSDFLGFTDASWKYGPHKNFPDLLAAWAAVQPGHNRLGRWIETDAARKPGEENFLCELYLQNTSIACGLKCCLWFTGGKIMDMKTLEFNGFGRDVARVNAWTKPLWAEIPRLGLPVAIYSTDVSKDAANHNLPREWGPRRMPEGLGGHEFPRHFWLQPAGGEFVTGVFKYGGSADAEAVYVANHNAFAEQDVKLKVAKAAHPRVFNREKGKYEDIDVVSGVISFKLEKAGGQLLLFP